MNARNTIEFKVKGPYALFTDPLTKIGGEKFSYQIPTYEALKGICGSIYWKPTFQWIVDEVRIMKEIKMQSKGMRPIHYQDLKNDLSIYTYLADVEYYVKAHFEWNENRKDLIQDRNENKHWDIAKRMIGRGGRRDVFLGTRECQGDVSICYYDDDIGEYDNAPDMSFGTMLHGITYSDEAYNDETKGQMSIRLWNPQMHNGRIKFIRPEECTIVRPICKQSEKAFIQGKSFAGLKEFEEKEVIKL